MREEGARLDGGELRPRRGELRRREAHEAGPEILEPPRGAAHEKGRGQGDERPAGEPDAGAGGHGDQAGEGQADGERVDPPREPQREADPGKEPRGRRPLPPGALDQEEAQEGQGEQQRERDVGTVGGEALVEEVGGPERQVGPRQPAGPLAEADPGAGHDREDEESEEEAHGGAVRGDRRPEEPEDERQVVRLQGAGVRGAVVEDGMHPLAQDVERHEGADGLVGGERDLLAQEHPRRGGGQRDAEAGPREERAAPAVHVREGAGGAGAGGAARARRPRSGSGCGQPLRGRPISRVRPTTWRLRAQAQIVLTAHACPPLWVGRSHARSARAAAPAPHATTSTPRRGLSIDGPTTAGRPQPPGRLTGRGESEKVRVSSTPARPVGRWTRRHPRRRRA